MKYLLLLSILISSPSMAAKKAELAQKVVEDNKKYKLLEEPRPGMQRISEVFMKAGINDPSIILWDERVDGPLPEVELGAMERSGDQLLINNEKRAIHEQVLADEAAAAQAKQDRIAQKRSRSAELLSLMELGKASNEEIQEFLVLKFK